MKMQLQDEILNGLTRLRLSLDLPDYAALGMAILGLVKGGDASQTDVMNLGIIFSGRMLGDQQFANELAEKRGAPVDEQPFRRELAQLNDAQLISFHETVMHFQENLPLMLKRAGKSLVKSLPSLRAGRHASLNEAQKKEVCERILDCERRKESRSEAIKSAAEAFDTSPSTISRAWAERDKLLTEPPHTESTEKKQPEPPTHPEKGRKRRHPKKSNQRSAR
jgi:hypothetical protein